jgi:hypothetical protein
MPRRTAALFFLLAFAFTQVAAAECPMRSAASSRPSTSDATMAMGGHLAHHHAPAAPHDRHDAGRDCALAAACGAVAEVRAAPSIARPAVVSVAAAAPAPRGYASPVLAADPPPPRSALPA